MDKNKIAVIIYATPFESALKGQPARCNRVPVSFCKKEMAKAVPN